ncbi:MAG TPA: hypothetical protein VH092_37700 [Urbifossiella sp.]|nr:hypothetical protein [Urbifossiella sp.]
MEYRVTCGCGKALTVRSGDAGATLRCACGRDVEVPSLHQLRLSAGEEALTPVPRIRAMLASGLLPGTHGCAVCGREPAPNARVHIECERAHTGGGMSKGEVLTGCLLGMVFGWLIGLVALVGLRGQPRQYGADVSVAVPLPVCETCRPALSDATALRRALRAVSHYADLLDRYPEARIVPLPDR